MLRGVLTINPGAKLDMVDEAVWDDDGIRTPR